MNKHDISSKSRITGRGLAVVSLNALRSCVSVS